MSYPQNLSWICLQKHPPADKSLSVCAFPLGFENHYTCGAAIVLENMMSSNL